jgi:hypothetical protein
MGKEDIFFTAERLFAGALSFDREVVSRIVEISQGYPYFAQLMGKECVTQANLLGRKTVDQTVLSQVMEDIKSGRAFPTLESAYQRAIGKSPDREMLLHLLAEQRNENPVFNTEVGRVVLKETRRDAEDLNIQYVDQLLPRLVDPTYGPVLKRIPDAQGIYEFVNPVLRLYVRLRSFSY